MINPLGQGLHATSAGIDPMALGASPYLMARELAKYIKCPTTIRARTLDAYGRAPHIEHIIELQEEARRKGDVLRMISDRMTPRDSDAIDYRVPPMPGIRKRYRAVKAPTKLREGPPIQAVTWRDVLGAVAGEFNLKPEEITGRSRKAVIVLARRTLIHVLFHRSGGGIVERNLSQIGHKLGYDHSTVRHALLRFDESASPFMRAVAAKYLGASE